MKKFLIIFILVLVGIQPTFAKEKKIKPFKFDGKKFELLYSKKTDDSYINEYYKELETYNNWTEMLAIHQFPKAESPVIQVKELKKYLDANGCPNNMKIDYMNNKAIIEFVIESKKRVPVIIEYNIFKYKMTENGVLAEQYAKRYIARTAFEQEYADQDIEKNQKKIIKKIMKTKYPELITQEIDKCYVPGLEKEKTNKEEVAKENNEEQIVSENAELDNEENITTEAEKEVKGEISEEKISEGGNDTKNEIIEVANDSADFDVNIDNEVPAENQSEISETTVEEKKTDVTENNISEQSKGEVSVNNKEVPAVSGEKESEIENAVESEVSSAIDNSEKVSIEKDKTEEISQEEKTEINSEAEKEKNAVNIEKTEKDVENAVKNSSKGIKEPENYKLINDKKDFYAKPRDYKKIRKEHKQQIKAAKKAEKIKNNPKKRAKEAAKQLISE